MLEESYQSFKHQTMYSVSYLYIDILDIYIDIPISQQNAWHVIDNQ